MTLSNACFQRFPCLIKLILEKNVWNFFPATTCSSKGSKLYRSNLSKPVIQNGQLCKFVELFPNVFHQGGNFYQVLYTLLRCSKLIIFTLFLGFPKIYPKFVTECHNFCTETIELHLIQVSCHIPAGKNCFTHSLEK